jgi:hypothetical protein
LAAFDITVTAGIPETSLSEDKTILTVIVPIVLPIGGQGQLLGVLRYQLDKDGAERSFRKALEQVEQMGSLSQLQVASNLSDVEKAAEHLDKFKG